MVLTNLTSPRNPIDHLRDAGLYQQQQQTEKTTIMAIKARMFSSQIRFFDNSFFTPTTKRYYSSNQALLLLTELQFLLQAVTWFSVQQKKFPNNASLPSSTK